MTNRTEQRQTKTQVVLTNRMQVRSREGWERDKGRKLKSKHDTRGQNFKMKPELPKTKTQTKSNTWLDSSKTMTLEWHFTSQRGTKMFFFFLFFFSLYLAQAFSLTI